MQLKTNHKRPSPKHNNHILSFAQSLTSVQDKKFPNFSFCSDTIEGISLFISRNNRINASMTVEAAIIMPIFLFFFLNLCSSIEMMRLHGNLQLALWEVGNRMSVYGCVLSDGEHESVTAVADEEADTWWNELAGVIWSYTYVKAQVIEYLGEDYLEASPLTYGSGGLQFVESNVYESEECFETVVTYSVSPMCGIAAFVPFRMSNRYYGHLWNGYEIPKREELVYVAENGVVYHTSRECTHLQLSVQQVSWQEAYRRTNAKGQKYIACERCENQLMTGMVYITDEGDCYHYERECPGLKRTIICMTSAEAAHLKRCRRCEEGKG